MAGKEIGPAKSENPGFFGSMLGVITDLSRFALGTGIAIATMDSIPGLFDGMGQN